MLVNNTREKIAHFVNIFYVNNHSCAYFETVADNFWGVFVSFASLSVFFFVAFEFQLNFKVLFW